MRRRSPLRVSWTLMGKPLPELEEEAAAVEDAGLDGVWYPDYQGAADPKGSYPELLVTLTVLSQTTQHLFLGSLVTDVLRRHPMATAHAFATLSHLAPGRLILGLGAGGGTSHLPFGIDMEAPITRLAEGMEVIRRLWRASEESPSSYRGRIFHLHRAWLPDRPSEPIPIYVAAFGPRMLRLAGEAGEGWVPEGHTPETYAQALARVEAERALDALPLDPCVALLYFPFDAHGPERDRVLRAAKTMLAFNVEIMKQLLPGAVPSGRRSLDLVVNPALWRGVAQAIPDEVAEQTILLGSASVCISRLRHYAASGCRHVVLEPFWEMPADQMKEAIAVAARIRDAFQSRPVELV